MTITKLDLASDAASKLRGVGSMKFNDDGTITGASVKPITSLTTAQDSLTRASINPLESFAKSQRITSDALTTPKISGKLILF